MLIKKIGKTWENVKHPQHFNSIDIMISSAIVKIVSIFILYQIFHFLFLKIFPQKTVNFIPKFQLKKSWFATKQAFLQHRFFFLKNLKTLCNLNYMGLHFGCIGISGKQTRLCRQLFRCSKRSPYIYLSLYTVKKGFSFSASELQ